MRKMTDRFARCDDGDRNKLQGTDGQGSAQVQSLENPKPFLNRALGARINAAPMNASDQYLRGIESGG